MGSDQLASTPPSDKNLKSRTLTECQLLANIL